MYNAVKSMHNTHTAGIWVLKTPWAMVKTCNYKSILSTRNLTQQCSQSIYFYKTKVLKLQIILPHLQLIYTVEQKQCLVQLQQLQCS